MLEREDITLLPHREMFAAPADMRAPCRLVPSLRAAGEALVRHTSARSRCAHVYRDAAGAYARHSTPVRHWRVVIFMRAGRKDAAAG